MLLPPQGALTELQPCGWRESNPRPPLARRSTEVTDIFTTAITLGNRRDRVCMTPTQALPRGRTGARDTTALARPPPRYVISKAGFEPAFPWSEVSEIFTTSVFGRGMRRPKGRHGNEDASSLVTTQTKLQNEYCRGALEHGAPPKRTPIGSPCDRWTAITRAVPSGRPRAFGRARSLARAPGSGSPVFTSLNEPCFGEQKTLRSGGSGGFVRHELSISLMRDRSHEPGTCNRMAGSHSTVRRGF